MHSQSIDSWDITRYSSVLFVYFGENVNVCITQNIIDFIVIIKHCKIKADFSHVWFRNVESLLKYENLVLGKSYTVFHGERLHGQLFKLTLSEQ